VPRDVVALVSADDFVSAVRVYADRANDLLRRNGVPALEAIEVCETHALALLDAVVNAPETVVDLAGWWFARAIETTSVASELIPLDASDEPVSMLAGTLGEEEVRAALAALPDGERAAVVLRDAYDLPGQAVGVALHRGVDSAAELTAAGRLHLVAAYDDRRVPDLSGHSGRTTVDLIALSRLADGSLDAPRAAPLRRHVSHCAACEEVLESLARGRRLAAGLPIIAMDDDARESLIDRVAGRAEAVLPTLDAVLRAIDDDHDPGPLIPPVLAIVVLVLALSLGVGIALVSRAASSPGPAPRPTFSAGPAPTPSFPLAPTFGKHRHTGSATPAPTNVVSKHPSKRPTQSSSPTSKPTKSPPPATGRPRISASPHSGRSGTTITVTGTGFPPGTVAHLSYAKGRSTSNAQVDANGDFVGQLTASALLPGQQTITATDGSKSATTSFTQHL
jgi:hypothetical protein